MQMTFSTLISGSGGNASVAATDSCALLIDAGAPGQTLSELLVKAEVPPEKLCGIIVTHDHVDHTSGVGVMARRYKLPVYATFGSWQVMSPRIGRLGDKQHIAFSAGETLTVGDFSVATFATPHDAAESIGMTVDSGGPVVGVMTDIGHADDGLLSHVSGCDVLLLEANHDIGMLKTGPYPPQLKERILSDRGHLSNAACGEALVKLVRAGLPAVILGHLSKENNTPQLALNTVAQALRAAGIAPGQDVLLDLAPRHTVGRRYCIG